MDKTTAAEAQETNQTTLQHYIEQLANLPTINCYSTDPLVHYNSCLIPNRLLVGAVKAQRLFQARPDDVFVACIPKSGITWLKALLFSTINRRSTPCSDPHHPLLSSNPHECVPFMEIEAKEDWLAKLAALPPPRIFSSHVPFHLLPNSIATSGSRVVYIARNPKDNFVSSWHFVNKIRAKSGRETVSLEACFEQFCSGVCMMGPYWDHVLGYWNASREQPDKVLFMKYEDLTADPVSELKRLAEFVGCPFTEEEVKGGVVEEIVNFCGFENLSSLEVNKEGTMRVKEVGIENKLYFRLGGVGDWKNHLSQEMVRRLDEITESKFAGTGLFA